MFSFVAVCGYARLNSFCNLPSNQINYVAEYIFNLVLDNIAITN